MNKNLDKLRLSKEEMKRKPKLIVHKDLKKDFIKYNIHNELENIGYEVLYRNTGLEKNKMIKYIENFDFIDQMGIVLPEYKSNEKHVKDINIPIVTHL
jgi:hypothetical protein